VQSPRQRREPQGGSASRRRWRPQRATYPPARWPPRQRPPPATAPPLRTAPPDPQRGHALRVAVAVPEEELTENGSAESRMRCVSTHRSPHASAAFTAPASRLGRTRLARPPVRRKRRPQVLAARKEVTACSHAEHQPRAPSSSRSNDLDGSTHCSSRPSPTPSHLVPPICVATEREGRRTDSLGRLRSPGSRPPREHASASHLRDEKNSLRRRFRYF
jgi:hypothetical protein